MTNPNSSVAGSWRGHYEQEGHRFGISMRVHQSGASFAGEMRDEHTLVSGGFEIGPEAEDPELIGKHVDALSTLPERSIVEGEVIADRVSFEKRYDGAHTIRVQVEGEELEVQLSDHRVTYVGRLVERGAAIVGRWRIPAIDVGMEDEGGVFELRREP